MKSHLKPIMRRKFLEKGVVGGAMIAFLPFRKLFSFSAPLSDFYLKSDCYLSKEYLERLLEIASKYGGEFAEVYVRRSGYGSV